MLPTQPTMRMLDNYRMTGSMMDDNWRQYTSQSDHHMVPLKPPHTGLNPSIFRGAQNLVDDPLPMIKYR